MDLCLHCRCCCSCRRDVTLTRLLLGFCCVFLASVIPDISVEASSNKSSRLPRPFRGDGVSVPRGFDSLPGGALDGAFLNDGASSSDPSAIQDATNSNQSTTEPVTSHWRSAEGSTTTPTINGSSSSNIVITLRELSSDQSDVTSSGRLPVNIRLQVNVTSSSQRNISVTLNLQRNDHVTADIPVLIGRNDGTLVDMTHYDRRTIFGVYFDVDYRASVKAERINASLLYYSGSFTVDQYEYHFEPASSLTRRRRSATERGATSRTRKHREAADSETAIYRGTKTPAQHNEPHNYEPSLVLPDANFIPYTMERGEDSNGTKPLEYIVETLAVIDYRIYLRWYALSAMRTSAEKERDAIDNIIFYFAHVYNGMNMRYQSIRNATYTIAVQLNGYYIATTPNASQYVEANRVNGTPLGTVQASPALVQFASWLDAHQGELPNHDQASLYTSENMQAASGNNILGLSFIKGICSSYSVVICKDGGLYQITETATHELGHNLGAGHDGIDNTCSFQDQYIMASYSIQPTDANYRNAFAFSSCSVAEFGTFLRTLANSIRAIDRCLTELTGAAVNNSVNLGQQPGQRYTPDQQCQAIYGPQSYYCGGRTEDSKICRAMECFHPAWRYCYVVYEQQAFEGTTCSNQSWCIMGDCQYDVTAPTAPNSCVYGDYKGPYSNGLSCSLIATTALWRCYDDYYNDDCCDTCVQQRDNSRPGCEYGDKDSNCETMFRAGCYNSTTRGRCCDTCRATTNISGCEYGDRVSWCASYIQSPSLCYSQGQTCCQTCNAYYTNISGCEYGNRVNWCDTAQPTDCYTDNSTCCVLCNDYYNSTNVGCEYGDKSDWCSTIHAYQCYQDGHICCSACKHYLTNVAGCEYGDREEDCNVSTDCIRPERQSACCRTCSSAALSTASTRFPIVPSSSSSSLPSSTTSSPWNASSSVTTTILALTEKLTTTLTSSTPPPTTTTTSTTTTTITAPTSTTTKTTTTPLPSSSSTSLTSSTLSSTSTVKPSTTTAMLSSSSLSTLTVSQSFPSPPSSTAGTTMMTPGPPSPSLPSLPTSSVTTRGSTQPVKSTSTSVAPESTSSVSLSPSPSTSSRLTSSVTSSSPSPSPMTTSIVTSSNIFPSTTSSTTTTRSTPLPTSPATSPPLTSRATLAISMLMTSTTVVSSSSASSASRPLTSRATPIISALVTSSTAMRTTSTTKPTGAGVNCPVVMQQPPSWCSTIRSSDCYAVSDVCCRSCEQHVYDAGSQDCYYGDHYSWCSIGHCSNPNLRSDCCATCGTLQTTTTTVRTTTTTRQKVTLMCPAGGDRAPYCKTMPSSDCYTLAETCCATCSTAFQNINGCEYGDRASWCSQYIRSRADCSQPIVAAYCCNSCSVQYGVQCSDSMPWCYTIHPSLCYTVSIQLYSCCWTCRAIRDASYAGCEYGDHYAWCDDLPTYFCAQYKTQCCRTCRRFVL